MPNSHQLSFFGYCSLCLVLVALAACAPAKKLARSYEVNKRTLKTRLVTTDKAGETKLRWRSGDLLARRQVLAEQKTDPAEFARIKALKLGRFHGPYLERDSIVYYLWRLESDQTPFASYIIAQFHQPFGIGEELFQERFDSAMSVSLAALNPKQALEDFPDDDEIGVGMVLSWEEKKFDQLRPEAIDFLKTAAVLAYDQSEKAKFPNTTITEVLIKTKPLVYYEYLNYAKVSIRKPLKDPK